MRVAFLDDGLARERHEVVHGRLDEAGLPHEWHRYGYVAILLRNLDDQEAAMAAFGPEIDGKQIEWEVDPRPFER